MILGLRAWELHLEGCASLKDKRSRIRPLTAALRRQFNVSVAETDHQGAWQRAQIACVAVGSARQVVEETLRSADRVVEEADGVRIMDTLVEWR